VSKTASEFARLEQMILRLSRAQAEDHEIIDRRMAQHEQALLELNAAQNGREDVPTTKGKRPSRKP
jgi:hypothetical protein